MNAILRWIRTILAVSASPDRAGADSLVEQRLRWHGEIEPYSWKNDGRDLPGPGERWRSAAESDRV